MNKKGFTLIELLAVIVILSIIVVIAVPRILDVIERVEMQSYKESVELMVHTAKLQYEASEVQGPAPTIPEEGIIYTYGYDETTKDTIQTNIDEVGLLNFKGDKPRSGSITLNQDKKVKVEKLVSKMRNGKYCAVKQYDGEVLVGKSTDSDFNCSADGQEQVTDDTPCELAQETSGTSSIYYIDSPEDMYKFSADVNAGNTYSGKTVKLRNNLNFSGYTKESKTTVCTNGDNANGYTPIRGFSGTFDGMGKTISNLTINRPSENNVGIFGSTNNATIQGIILDNINVTGATYVGTLIGLQNSGYTRYIEVKNATLKGNDRVSGITGEASYGTVLQSIVKNVNIQSNNWAGYVAVNNGTGIVEHATITAPNIYQYTVIKSNAIKHNGNNITDGFNEISIGDINYYESKGLNTWIDGDNDNLGYYYDYESESGKNIVLKSTNTTPVPSNINNVLTKQGEYYLIKNTADWKNMSAFVNKGYKFKLTENLSFNNKQFYMMGSEDHPFNGIFNGGAKTISNITVQNPNQNNVGVFGKTRGATIYGLNLNNINLKGNSYVGGLVGYAYEGSAYEISINNSSMEGSDRASGISGVADCAAVYNALVKNVTLKSNNWAGYVAVSNGSGIVEHANVTCANIYQASVLKSSDVKLNGSNITDGFETSKIDDLDYYSSTIETKIKGDVNNTGYYFAYVPEKEGVYVVDAVNQDGWVLINSISPLEKQKWSYFENGQRIESGLRTLKDFSNVNQSYYFENGVAVLGFKTINNKTYYFSELDEDNPKNNYVDAKMIKGRTINIKGTNYTFNSNGECTNCN